jgi:DNA-binding response OmpR family regulator
MNDQQFSALVVDDEPALRRLTVAALKRFNFSCDEAGDGDEAGSLLGCRKYDVVITDLRMPKRNGHALAVELLSAAGERPLVVILTGVLEPRLAQDLIARGVDEVEFKPVNFALFGAKIRARCERRIGQLSPSVPPHRSDSESQAAASEIREDCQRVTRRQVEERLKALADALPVSPAAFEVVKLINEEIPNAQIIAQCIARDPGLSVELLKLANSSYYNPIGQLSDDLHSAILRLGHRKIAELAVTSASLQVLAKSQLRWVDAGTIWRRSVITGKAIEYLHSTATVGSDDEGLFLSATLMPMSRVFLGLAYPELYRQLIERCREKRLSLASLEREALELPPEQALAKYLACAGLSPRLYKPLKHGSTAYAELASLTEPLRSKVERMRIAAVLGNVVVGRWAPWDEIDFPSPNVMRRVGVEPVASVIDRLRVDLARLASNDASAAAPPTADPSFASELVATEIRYFKLTVEPFDLLVAVLESLGMRVVPVSRDVACSGEPVLINCLDVSDERLAQFLEECQPNSTRVLIGNDASHPTTSPRGAFVAVPCSFGQFLHHLQAAVPKPELVI